MNKLFENIRIYILNPFLEIFNKYPTSNYKYLIFIFIPVVFYLNAIIAHTSFGTFYLHNVDPEYFHLFNGLAIAKGNFDVQYIAHPGTLLEFLYAFTARILNGFQSNDHLYKDFVNDPEKFIHATVLFQNIIIALIIYWGSLKILNYSKSITIALGFQLLPFANFNLLQIAGRIIPESTMLIPMLLVIILIIKHIYTDKSTTNSDLIKWGLIMGLGISCKLSFIPVIILPVILLKTSFKQKMLYGIYTLIAIAIFAYPIVVNFRSFWTWVSGMATHSGKYGAGENKIVDVSTLVPNMEYMFSQDKMFFILIWVTFLLLIINFFKSGIDNRVRLNHILRSVLAVNTTLIIAILFTLKHYEFHYFFPYFVFKFVQLLLIYIIIISVITHKKVIKAISLVFIFLLISISSCQNGKLEISLNEIRANSMANSENAANFNRLVTSDQPLIITGTYYGSPFMAFAQSEGFNLTYKQQGDFKKYLWEKYPNTYVFYDWATDFYRFGKKTDINDILTNSKSASFYVFIGQDNHKNIGLIEDRIYAKIDSCSIVKDTILTNPISNELLLRYSIH